MPFLHFDHEHVRAKLREGGKTAQIAAALREWQPDGDISGLALLYDLIDSVSGGRSCTWRVDLESVAIEVLAHFSCDNANTSVYNGDLTLSMMIDGSFEVADLGVEDLHDLVDFTATQDGPERVLALLEAVTVRLDAALAQAMRFTRALSDHQRRTAGTTPVPQPLPADRAPTVEDIAAQIRREAAFSGGQAWQDTSAPRLWTTTPRPSAAELIAAREHALTCQRDSFIPEVDKINSAWRDAGCPAVRVESVTPGGGSEYDTEFVFSNGARLLLHSDGVLVSDTRSRHLHFLEVVNLEGATTTSTSNFAPDSTAHALPERPRRMININVENGTKIVVTVHDSGGGASEICIEENTDDIEIVVDAARSTTALVTVNDSATQVHAARD